jgi:malonate-semialdehyde dehydrogenase (acetylating) / methylmalonate-semialdehyde dehydrogenase
MVNGSVDVVNFLCDEPRIKAISFVGGNNAGKHIYDRAGEKGKRVQANLGAKSELSGTSRLIRMADPAPLLDHAILMPDANKNFALNSIAGAAFGGDPFYFSPILPVTDTPFSAAGQRCMALSVVVTVGDTHSWLSELIERAKALKVGNGFVDGVEM